MERNVQAFAAAVKNGHEPQLYTYDAEKIPLGGYDAVLDFKTWSKRIMAINCYFTKAATGEKFVATVYHNNKTGRYNIEGSAINFADCATAAAYHICIGKNRKDKIVITQAMAL